MKSGFLPALVVFRLLGWTISNRNVVRDGYSTKPGGCCYVGAREQVLGMAAEQAGGQDAALQCWGQATAEE